MNVRSESLVRGLFWPIILIFALLAIAPLYLLFKVTVSAPTEVLTQHPSFIVEQFTTAHWERVIETGVLLSPFRKSLIVATLTAGLALAICTPGAYAIAQLPSRLKYSIILTMFVTRMLPEVAIALPIAVTFIRLNLIETELGLALAHLILALPLVTWILVGTFETVPKDLEEAAMTDGCSRLRALWHVSIPLALPGISVATIYTWLLSWEEFTYAVYLSILDKTLPLKIFQFVAGGELFFSSAFAVIVTIPVLIITYSLQKYLRAGYLAGGVKG